MISFISLIAVAGLVLSVAVLLLVTSVINGFERELEQRVLGVLPHVSVRAREPLIDWAELAQQLREGAGVLGASPFVEGTGLVAGNNRSAGVLFRGIDPASHSEVSRVTEFVTSGSLDALVPGSFGAVLGAGVAERMMVEVGDRVTAVLPDASVTLVGVVPRQRRLEVVGIVETGSELDNRGVYLHLADASRLFRLAGRVQGVHLRIDDLFAANQVARWAVNSIGPDRVYATTWMRIHGNLYRAIGFQRATMFLLLSLLVGVAAFNLVSALVMVVNQRRSDVAILRTLGSDTTTLVMSFVVLGALIGAVGVGLGLILGIGSALVIQDGFQWLQNALGVQLMGQYFVNYLPAEVRASDVLTVAGVAMALCLLSTLYPAIRAASLEPAEVLRHE
jgi:lipoprotein-releasing system permease protein